MNSQSEPIKTISTSNLLEVSYLLERHHRITGVESKVGTYGVPELFVTLEGVMIDLDHKSVLSSSSVTLKGLGEAMGAIEEAAEGMIIERTVSS